MSRLRSGWAGGLGSRMRRALRRAWVGFSSSRVPGRGWADAGPGVMRTLRAGSTALRRQALQRRTGSAVIVQNKADPDTLSP